jgi:hypothetical protein
MIEDGQAALRAALKERRAPASAFQPHRPCPPVLETWVVCSEQSLEGIPKRVSSPNLVPPLLACL